MNMFLLTTLVFGICSQYDPGVMESVIRTRQAGYTSRRLPRSLPKVDGYIAVKDCREIGNIVWMRKLGDIEWETFLIVDCASKDDGGYQWMDTNNVIAEVDFETAKRWGVIGHGVNIEMMKFRTVRALAN
jgi:hypothetical protein